MYISIEPQLDDAIEEIGDLVRNEKSIRKSILSQVGTKAKTRAKRDYKTILNKKSGNLYKSIRKYVYRNGKAVVITAHNIGDTNRYGFILAHGFTSEVKNESALTFQIDGKWIRKHSVTVKPKDFIQAPVKNYLSGGQINQDLETITQKKIDSLTKKYNKES